MNSKLLWILLIAALAALSPAPIRDIMAKGHDLPVHSRAQRKADQRFDGTYGVVGEVPKKTNEDGTAPASAPSDSAAANVVSTTGALVSQRIAVRNLTRASADLRRRQEGPVSEWILGVVVLLSAFGLFQGFRYWLEKHGPSPKSTKRF